MIFLFILWILGFIYSLYLMILEDTRPIDDLDRYNLKYKKN